MRKALMASTIICLMSAQASAEQPFAFQRAPGQLPKDVVPQAYRIDIGVDLERLALTGSEEIDVDVQAPTDTVMLNQAGLKLSSALTQDGAAATITLDEAAQTATLKFPQKLTAGRHTLRIAYTGPIPATPNGIYYDDYRTAHGTPARMLVTQFEVADARRMFPGWDEPAFKATFQLSVTLSNGLVPVSNMPIASTGPAAPGMKHVVFAQSPRMSTYLLALVAGDLSALHSHAGQTEIGLWAPTGSQDQGDYALHAAAAILPYYNSYFGVPYPLPKLDLIAIPGNYEAGAMENWGAITFIDNTLLFDTAKSAPSTRETVYLDVAHEMAHQWSGDLVTMGWWDNIWLNEGFATWMEIKATDHFNPGWEMWPRQHEAREDAMGKDALSTTHPIQQVIHDVSEANSAFDAISYQKGALVIRMVEDWIGPDVFRAGMRDYMKAHAYGNTTSADLWAALSNAAGKDVAAVARSYTEQPGVPLVHVARTCKDGGAEITLTQSRFTVHDAQPKPFTWQIPVTLGPVGNTPGPAGTPDKQSRVVLGEQPVTIRVAGCDGAIKANLGEAGYYRTQYDPGLLGALKAGFTSLAPVDRANLLGDEFALFTAGSAPLTDTLDLLPSLAKERDVAVWEDTLEHLLRLDELVRGSPLQTRYRAFARQLIAPEFERLGWSARPDESFPDSLLRPHLIAALGRFDDTAVAAEALRRFAAMQNGGSGNDHVATLPPNLLEPVLGIVGRHADRATWEKLKSLGEQAPGTEAKLRYFDAMANAQDPELTKANIAFASSGSIPNGRITSFLARVSTRAADPGLVWTEVLSAKAEINKRLAPWSQTFMLPAATYGSSDPATATSLLAQPETTGSTGGRLEAAKAAEAIRATADLRARALPELQNWLSKAL